MMNELSAANVFDYIPGRKYDNFKTFCDMFSRINVVDLHKWLSKQKERLSYETILGKQEGCASCKHVIKEMKTIVFIV